MKKDKKSCPKCRTLNPENCHSIFCPMRKPTHGGKRKGAGRPAKEPTTTMRVPVSKVDEIKKLIGKA